MSFLSAVAHEEWMKRCLQLARNGAGHVAPNPLVGAVLVRDGRVLAEGWHRAFGGAHAEVECMRAFGEQQVPHDATLYVNLEPCAHHGKTPPCVDMIIARGIKQVVVGCVDPDPLVKGKGIARAREAGIHMEVGVLEDESRWINRRFITAREQGRPYVVLKWAQSADGLLDQRSREERAPVPISSPATNVLVHRWRSEEQAILVGSRTALLDDPALTVRNTEGRSPLRVLLDRSNVVPAGSRIFNAEAPTLLFTDSARADVHVDQVVLNKGADLLDVMLDELFQRGVHSVLVEGGAELLGHFIARDRWDEARVITGPKTLGEGTRAPVWKSPVVRTFNSDVDRIDLHTNQRSVEGTWYW